MWTRRWSATKNVILTSQNNLVSGVIADMKPARSDSDSCNQLQLKSYFDIPLYPFFPPFSLTTLIHYNTIYFSPTWCVFPLSFWLHMPVIYLLYDYHTTWYQGFFSAGVIISSHSSWWSGGSNWYSALKEVYLGRFVELEKCAKPWHMDRYRIAINGLT